MSLACALWLLNALTGAAVAIREDLPGELIAGAFVGRDASIAARRRSSQCYLVMLLLALVHAELGS